MRFTQFAIVLLLITTLVVLGCSSDDSLEIAEGGFLGGTQGIVADFEPFGVEEEGKLTIFNTEAFPIEVTVQNKGEYDTQAGDVVVSLLGPSPEEFSGIASSSLPNAEILDPISELVPEGGEETITFASDATYEGSVSGFVDRTWFGNIEYRYQTYTIVSEVCLKEDLSDSRICDVNGAKTFLLKWGFSIKFFKKYYLRSDEKFDGLLREPEKSFLYYFNLVKCRLSYLFHKLIKS